MPMSGRTDPRGKLKLDDVRNYVSVPVLSPPVHQSHLSDWWTCPRYYFFRYRLGLVPKMQTPGAKDIGHFFHKALEVLYLGGTLMEASSAVGGELDTLERTIRKVCQEKGVLDVADSTCQRLSEYATQGLLMARIFYERFPIDPDRFSVVHCEIDVENIPLTEIGHSIGGRLDLMLYCRKTKGLYVFDHKTIAASQNLTEYSEHLSYDFQARLYRRLAICVTDGTLPPLEFKEPKTGKRMTTEGLPVLGFVLNGMRKFEFTQKEGQTDDMFLSEILDYYEARQSPHYFKKHADPFKKNGEPRKGVDEDGFILDVDSGERKKYYHWDHRDKADLWAASPPMQQFLVRFNEPELPDELALILGLVGRAARCRPTTDNFPRLGELTGHCRYFYGRPCTFRKLCPVHPVNWDAIIHGEFNHEDRYAITPGGDA